MQLKFKRICLLSTIIIYCASFLIESNFALFEVWAQEKNTPLVNIVAVLVDDKIYNWISWWLSWYTSSYIQNELADTKALVIPLDLTNIHAYDIYRMMENIYFDGLKNVNSQLIWLIMFGDIPLPVANQEWYIFPTVYPYVDFENQKYVWDPESNYFVPNNNPLWQAEIWHGLINYWTDIWAYNDFFSKIQKYKADPDEFIWNSMWYDDFIAQKKEFIDEFYPFYRNRIMFAEDLWYQRHSPLMKKMFRWEEAETAVDIVTELEEAGGVEYEWREVLEQMVEDWVTDMHSTKMVQQEIESNFISDYNDLFSKESVSTMRENSFAWWRWIKEYVMSQKIYRFNWLKDYDRKNEKRLMVDVDGSAAKMQLKDDLLLWNDDLQWLIENLNELMEDMIDKKIMDENLSMDIVVPLSYKEVTKKWVDDRCYSFVDRYENYYFWDNARLIDKAEDLSIYRWTYRNLSDLTWVTYDTLLEERNPAKSEYDSTNLRLKSIWWSYDIFSSQAEWNRWYTMLGVERDLDIYDEEKTRAKSESFRSLTSRVRRRMWLKFCDDDSDDEDEMCEKFTDFAKRWRWWASTINLVDESISKWRYELKDYLATDSWRPIFWMDWFQSLQTWDDEWINWIWWHDWKWKWPQWDANSFMAYIKYSSPTQREWWRRTSWLLISRWYEIYENHTPDVHIPFSRINYWQLKPSIIASWKFKKDANSDKIFYIEKNAASSVACYWKNKQYGYKVINSVVKHKSTTEDQINWIDRDKYWESWTLGKYYHDIRTSYEDVQENIDDILEAFPELVSEVNSGDAFIRLKMKDLEAEMEKMEPINEELSGYNSQLSGLQQDLENAKSSDTKEIEKSIKEVEGKMKKLDEQKTEYQEQLDELNEQLKDATGNEYRSIKKSIATIENNLKKLEEDYKDLEDELEELNEQLEEGSWENIQEIENAISEVEGKIAKTKEKKKAFEWNIDAILNVISWTIVDENSQLEDIFKLVKWLGVENVISVLEFIIYLEWWFPDAYYDWWDGKIVKIWFLSSWLSNIEDIKWKILEDVDKIVEYYNKTYSLIQKQQEDWDKLAEKLKEESEWNAEKIDKVTWMMDQIFTIDVDPKKYVDELKAEDDEDDLDKDDGEDEEAWWPVTLTAWTAKAAIDEFKKEFKKADKIYWNLVEQDKVGPAIISAAKSDIDFMRWMIKNSVNFREFSEVDWINQYAQWAQGPGYDSPWAIKNHDLLIWVSEHMSWMNILTPDRPIDSPRYTIMQSVAWTEMKFIYPDLFKVEVFKYKGKNRSWYDKHELLTWAQIKENLIKYLNVKVEEYNTIMQKECANALPMDIYFSRLRSLWYTLATPDKALHSCDSPFTYDEFVEALWWEKMLDVIAETLYYHNLTNKKKLSSKIVKKDIELIKKTFSLNYKREQIMKDYLIEWNEKIKHPIFEIPTYEVLWYEVAYINSDWRDFIFPVEWSEEDNPDEFSQSVLDATSESFNIDRRQSSKYEEDLADECGIPSNWKLPIFSIGWSPWLKWFKCWWKKTLKDPIKIKLTFDNSLWEILHDDELDWDIREEPEWQTFNDRLELKNRYADKWDELKEWWTWYDADKAITELQVKAEEHNQEVMSWSSWLANALSNVSNNVRISNTDDLLSDSNPTSNLRIESAVDVWTISVTFTSTWDWCIKVDTNTLCNGSSFTKTFNPKNNPYSCSVESADHVAWKIGLDMKIGVWWWYIENIIKYTVSPSTLERVEIKLLDKKTIAWMLSPVVITWYDKYNNVVDWWLERYDFTVSQWRFLKDWAYQESFTTNDFRNLNFYYQAPIDAVDWSNAIIQISSSRDPSKILWTYQQKIAQANPVIKMNWNIVLQWKKLMENASYKLSSDESIYNWRKLNVSKLKKLEVEMRDSNWNLVDIDSQILVTSQNWLNVLWQITKQQNWEEEFFETSKNYMTWGYAVIYYYPTTVAGDDIINVDIPWLDTRVINYKIYAAKTSNVQLDIVKEYVKLDEETDFEIYTSDIWWNPTDTTLEVIADPRYVDIDLPKLSSCDKEEDEECVYLATIKDWYLKTSIYWVSAGLTEVTAWWAYLEFKVDTNILPMTWLNIMYLNYFWNDWWNQRWYFSDYDNYVEELMKKSNKIITTTTMLTSEEKIKKLLWKIEKWFQIVNSENIDTIMFVKSGKLNMLVWWVGNMQDKFPSFSWTQVNRDTMNRLLNSASSSSKNYAFFFPSDSKYKIDNWVLYSSWVRVWSIPAWEITLFLSDETLDNWDNVWNVIDRWINYWDLVFHYPDFMPKVWNFEDPWERYLISSVFAKGSTDNMTSVWIFDWLSEFELDTNYKSIQNSDELDEKVWFLWHFKNITLFWEWEIVWEATKKYWSELLINLWDPVLSRKDTNEMVYGTDYDWWIWQEIYVDSEADIFGTYQIDFNNDWLKDWLVIYLDWTLKLAKNYWWRPDLRNMQELLRVAVHIQEAFVWDADGNGYEDILVLTDNNQIRAYLNYWWKFDVDWSVACLNQNVFGWQVSETPSSLEWVIQIFVDDMNLDGKVDIITYDKVWYVKIFYWWSTSKWPNYLSTEKFACDTGWYEREASKIHVVTALWTQVWWHDVRDNAMMHWVWISRPIDEDGTKLAAPLPKYWVFFDPASLPSLVKPRQRNSDGYLWDLLEEVMDKDKFDVDYMDAKYTNIAAKYVDTTLYENILFWWENETDEWHNYLFAPISFIDPDPMNCDDPCKVHKNFSVKKWWWLLMDGDIVTAKVTIRAWAFCSCVWAFWDIIQWPWNAYYDEKEIIEHFRPGINWKNAVLKKKDWNFAYLVDNINLAPGEVMTFEYDLQYHHMPTKKLSITYDTFYWDWPDLKVQSVDWCEKDFDVYHQWVAYEHIPLQDMINDEYLVWDEISEDFAEDVMSYWSDANQLPWIVWDTINRVQLLQWNNAAIEVSDDKWWKENLKSALLQKFAEWWFDSNLVIDLSLVEGQTDELEEIVDDITKWMCNGFSFWWSSNCKWLPVPFNQAFLAPGKYHLFGCWELPVWQLEKWVPMFNFPGTMYVAWVPIPIPWWLKWPSDGFLWAPWWEYNSFIRIYAAPTLTAQLWIAVCMWDYSVGYSLKSPWSDIWGNCVVFAVKPQCKDKQENDLSTIPRKKDLDNPNAIYEKFTDVVRDSWVCKQSTKWPYWEYTPFVLYEFSSTYHWETTKWITQSARDWFEKNVDVGWWSNYNVDYKLNALWLIQLEATSYAWPDDDTNNKNQIFIWDVDVLWWDYEVNKIKWWIRQWIRKILIDNWLDPQIRYIVNHLTKMHVNVKLPDLSNVIDSEIQTLKDATQKIWDVWKNTDTDSYTKIDTWWASRMKWWAYINHDNLNKLNKSISNPFEWLADLMNESNIINISTEPITVKIPMIFAEDINAYELYLQQRLEVNEGIVNQWKNILSEWEFEAKFGWWQKMQGQIYSNLMILQKYRNFPFEVYEWIHVIDRYMSEIAALISDTIGYLAYWTSTNSERFVGYVDAIVLMLNIIKTYQILIDFSIEWWQNCGNCSRDTYDQYTCKLSLLCDGISLPIIQIPNFKLPNITIDLTNIDLGLDIILPDFNFQPVRINLPDIPNIPEPPSVAVDVRVKLPDIPLLPEPPELPDLPSFIPEVDLELPILPPAPELPKFPSEIEAILKIAKLIWKIFCIVKWKFGLVWESSVKAKIEQLTQRTYEVKWIDAIMDFTNLSIAPIHHYGLDYEISSYVDLQFDFTAFYSYLDTLTKSINNLSTSSVNWLNQETNNLVNNNPLMWVRDAVDWWNININWTIGMADPSLSEINNIKWLLSDEIEYVDYDSAKARFEEVLAYFKKETKDTTMWDDINSSVDKIEKQINRKNTVVSNTKWIENMENEVLAYLDQRKSWYDDLAKLIEKDYDGFLAMVESQYEGDNVKSADDENKLLTFNVKLFDVDSATKDTIKMISKSNPYETILENKKTIIDWYSNAIKSSTAEDLWLTTSQYLVLRNHILDAEDYVSSLYSVTKPVSSTELIAKNSSSKVGKTLVAANGWEYRLWSNMEVAEVIDPSLLSQWIYDKILYWPDAWKLTKVVFADSFASVMVGRHYHAPHWKWHNIVMFDEEAVYLKCPWGECAVWWWGYWWFYHSKTVKEIPYKETWLEFAGDTILKIADWDEEVKNRSAVGQSYDSITLSRDLEDVDAYLIKLVERVDHSYEKVDYISAMAPVIYVLAVPDDIDQEALYKKKLEIIKKIDVIEKLDWKELVQVVYYDNYKPRAGVSISNIERKWYYARIATLNLKEDTYNINSPWSNQVVAWRQMVWDQMAPIWNPVLYRPSIKAIVSEWDDLEWFVWTRYQLIVNWKDNVALYYINLSKDWVMLDEKFTSKVEDTVSTSIDIHTREEKEVYNSVWIDQFGNKTEKVISVNYSIPEITITDISKNSDWSTVSIIAELSQDIDQWNVSFQRRRWSVWKTMETEERHWLRSADIPIGPKQTIVVWSPFTQGNEIAMYDKNWNVMALMNPDTAEIKLQEWYKDNYEVNVNIEDSSILQVCNKKTKVPVFSIAIPTENCVKFEAEDYKIVDLPENWKMGMYNGWKAIYKDWTNILFASKTCHLYSELWLEWTYDYDRELDAVVLTLYQSSDLLRRYPIKVWFKVKPFFEG